MLSIVFYCIYVPPRSPRGDISLGTLSEGIDDAGSLSPPLMFQDS